MDLKLISLTLYTLWIWLKRYLTYRIFFCYVWSYRTGRALTTCFQMSQQLVSRHGLIDIARALTKFPWYKSNFSWIMFIKMNHFLCSFEKKNLKMPELSEKTLNCSCCASYIEITFALALWCANFRLPIFRSKNWSYWP